MKQFDKRLNQTKPNKNIMNKINTKMDQAIAKLANIEILHLSSPFFYIHNNLTT